MKFAVTSPVLDFLGTKLVGSASALFGLPPGAFSDLYWMHYDRPAPKPSDPYDPAWMRRRVFEVSIRRQLSLRVGILASAMAMAIVIAGLFFLGATAGVQHAWASHKAQEAAAAAQAEQAKEQAEQQAQEAKEQSRIDAVVMQYAQQCKQAAATGYTKLTAAQIEAVSVFGCDVGTGVITNMNIARFTAKQKIESGNSQ